MKFDPQSLQAILDLTTASSTATEYGFSGVARAGERVTFVLVQAKSTEGEDKLNQQISELQARVAELLAQIKLVGPPLTELFRCQHDFDQCLTAAKTGVHKFSCWTSYAACLAQQFTTFASKR